MGNKYKGDIKTLLVKHGIISNTDIVLKAIRERSSEPVLNIDYINSTSDRGLLYLNNYGEPLKYADEYCESVAMYKIVPLGYKYKVDGEELCGSFIRNGNDWKGLFVATLVNIIRYIKGKGEQKGLDTICKDVDMQTIKLRGAGLLEIFNNNNIEYYNNLGAEDNTETINIIDEDTKAKLEDYKSGLESNKSKCNSEDYDNVIKNNCLYSTIYDMLLNKDSWGKDGSNKLKRHIKTTLNKVMLDRSRAKSRVGNGYVESIYGSKLLFNTGLIDCYNNDIYLIDNTVNESDVYKKSLEIVVAKASLINHGFEKKDLINMPKPVKFYSDKSELVFSGSIEDFDMRDISKLNHIINERRNRFPDKYKSEAVDVLADKVRLAIQKALRMSERDYRYIVPMYNEKLDIIQYLIPLHLDKSMNERSELVVVVGENNGFYCVYTILSIEDGYMNARLLSSIDNNWIVAGNN